MSISAEVAVVEEARTAFEKRNDVTAYIPDLKVRAIASHLISVR